MSTQAQSPQMGRAAFSMQEFAALFGRHKVWAYRRMYDGDLRVIRGIGMLMVPATEVERLQSLAETTTSRRRRARN